MDVLVATTDFIAEKKMQLKHMNWHGEAF